MSIVPATWGAGQLFAYSGMEGPTRAASPMVAHTLGERIGLRVFFDPPIELWCQATREPDPGRKYPRCMPRFEIVAGDAIRLRVDVTNGHRGGIAFAPVDQDTIVGYTMPEIPVRWSVGASAGRPLGDGVYTYKAEEGAAALAVTDASSRARFALAHDAQSESDAVARARRALDCDVDALIDSRRSWYERIECPAALPDHLVEVYRKAVAILRVNTCTAEGRIRHRWTTPDRWPHRWMWLHDSAYHTAGHAHHFPDLAQDMLAAVFDTQEADGRIALLMRPDGNWPEISQSPILAWATRRVFETTSDHEFAAAMYPKLEAYLGYFERTRAFGETGLHRWLHSDESMDNNPRFDAGADFGAVDLSCTLGREFEDVAALAEALGRSDEARTWRERHEQVGRAVNERLWDEASGQYGDLYADGRLAVRSTCVTFLPLFGGVATAKRAVRLVGLLTDPAKFWRPLPVPTVAADDAAFYPDMWRGPAWLNVNHLIAIGLDRYGFFPEASELRHRSVETVAKWHRHTGCVYEFYDCDDRIPPFALDRKSRLCYGQGFTNVSDYHWSAAIFIAMCRRLYA